MLKQINAPKVLHFVKKNQLAKSLTNINTARQTGKPTFTPNSAPPRRLNTKVPGIHHV